MFVRTSVPSLPFSVVHTCAAAAANLLLVAAATAQDKEAELAAKYTASAQLEDPASTSPLHVYGDARGFRAKVAGDRIECVLEMAKPLLEGMFTCVELDIDCDAKSATGIDGRELRVRAAVGSRFQPSDAKPTNGVRAPIDHCRTSYSEIRDDGGGNKVWIHAGATGGTPEVKGAELHFWFPKKLVRDRGDRYHGRMSARLTVETSCSDQPVERLHACGDEGMPIVVDGNEADWSAQRVVDETGELHRAAECIDLANLRVDHGANCFFACVEFAKPGFLRWSHDEDVFGWPEMTVLVEPMFPRYQKPYEVPVIGGRSEIDGKLSVGDFRAAVTDRHVELTLPRAQGQNRARIVVFTDMVLRDQFPVKLRLDAEAQ